jgi:hypothetical protein
MINTVLFSTYITLVNVFGTAPYCTDNGLSLSCYYYSPQNCLRAAEQLDLLCVHNPKRDLGGYRERSYQERRRQRARR